MSENFYDELLKDIQEAIESQDYAKAASLINEELSMPYSPQRVLDQLAVFQQKIEEKQDHSKTLKVLTVEQIEEYLRSDNERALEAVNYLRQTNCRQYLEVFETALKDETLDHYLRVLLLEVLIEQGVNQTFEFTKADKQLTVNPATLPEVSQQENLPAVVDLIHQRTSKNPSFQGQCDSVLAYLLYAIYPELIKHDDIEKVAYSVIRYVYNAYGQNEQWQIFARKYSIDENDLLEIFF